MNTDTVTKGLPAQYNNIGKEDGVTIDIDVSKRFQKITDREFRSDTSENDRYWEDYGKYKTHYKGIKMLKDCKSLTITYQLMYEIKAKTVFELGTYRGGFTLWLADQLDLLYGKKEKTQVVSLEKFEELVDPLAKNDERVKYVFDDVSNLEKHLTPEIMENLPRPWIVFEDCHVNLPNTLEFFRKHMRVGDYLFVEDLSNVSPDQTSYNKFKKIQGNKKWDGSVKRTELVDWVKDKEEEFLVDTHYCDFYGYNGTVQWDGVMKKIK